MISRERNEGFALVAVIWLAALLGAMGISYASSARLEAVRTRTLMEGVRNQSILESAVELGWHEYHKYNANQHLLRRQEEVEAQTEKTLDLWVPREEPYEAVVTDLTTGRDIPVLISLRSETGKLDFEKTLASARFKTILETCGLSERDVEGLVDAIKDWIDPDDLHRINGAEDDDYYSTLEEPYQCKNQEIQSLEELTLVKGVTPELLYGTDEAPGLADFLSPYGSAGNKMDLNSASPKAFAIVENLSDAALQAILDKRREKPLRSVKELGDMVTGEEFSQLNMYFTVAPPQWITVTAKVKKGGTLSSTRRVRAPKATPQNTNQNQGNNNEGPLS